MWIHRLLVSAFLGVLAVPGTAAAYACPPSYVPKLHAEYISQQIIGRGLTVYVVLTADTDCKNSSTRVLTAAEFARLEVTSATSADGTFAPLLMYPKAPVVSIPAKQPGAQFVRFRLPPEAGEQEKKPAQVLFFVTDRKTPPTRPLQVTLVDAPSVPKGSPPPTLPKERPLMLRLLPPSGLPPEQRETWQLPLTAFVLKKGRSELRILPPGLYEVGEGEELKAEPRPEHPMGPRRIFRALLGVVSIDNGGVVKLPFLPPAQ